MKNVRFLPMQERDRYLELLQASDVCLATLRDSMKTPVVPAKILSVMAAGRPLVAAFPPEGDAPAMIREAGCGVCVEAGNPSALAQAVAEVLADPERAAEYGRRGRVWAETRCSMEGCASAYERMFTDITRRSNVGVS